MPLSATDLDAICGLVIDLCGIYLDESKTYLIESRLADLMKRSSCTNYAELAKKVRYSNDAKLKHEVVDAITTRETLFFRDPPWFDVLRNKVFPDVIDQHMAPGRTRRIRIWCAASSTGQEPYSIAMTLAEMLPNLSAWDINIAATDISEDAIARTSKGWYAPHEVQRGLTPEQLNKYFRPENNGWRINDQIRSMVSVRKLNLLEPFVHMGPYDVVFCRNVAIYFTPEARDDLFNRIATLMTKEGYLFVGASETLFHLGKRFAPQHHCRSVFYRPNLPIAEPARV